jgi:hypothetical protein
MSPGCVFLLHPISLEGHGTELERIGQTIAKVPNLLFKRASEVLIKAPFMNALPLNRLPCRPASATSAVPRCRGEHADATENGRRTPHAESSVRGTPNAPTRGGKS